MNPTNITMRGGFNFQKLHQRYWGVIQLLRVFSNFMLD
jgi:hypothetical protein